MENNFKKEFENLSNYYNEEYWKLKKELDTYKIAFEELLADGYLINWDISHEQLKAEYLKKARKELNEK